jgi:hypothetical protein
MRSIFPNITEFNSKPTSPATGVYNCIAWAYGRDDGWFEPDPLEQYCWPISRREYSIDAYKELFSSIGYIHCANASNEDGFLKIALYIDEKGQPTHAARQLEKGKWTSKLGFNIDIEHDSPEVLNGKKYGTAKVFMKREIDSCNMKNRI